MPLFKNYSHVIGIDLSYTATGYAILATDSLRVTHGVYIPERVKQAKGSPKKEPTIVDDLARIDWIRRQVNEETMKLEDPLVVLEDFAFARANMAHQLGGLGYIVRLSLWKRNLPFIVVAPGRLKKFVSGKGSAEKDMMIMRVFKNWGHEAQDNNAADAIGLAYVGAAAIDAYKPTTDAQREVTADIRKKFAYALEVL